MLAKQAMFMFLCSFLLFFCITPSFAQSRIYHSKKVPDPAILVVNIKKFKPYNRMTDIQVLGLQNMSGLGMYKIYFCSPEGCTDKIYLVKLNSNIWIIRDNIMPNMMTGGSWRTVTMPPENNK